MYIYRVNLIDLKLPNNCRVHSQVAGSLSRRVIQMSMDGDYISDRTRRGADARDNGPRHAMEGLRRGAEGLGRGVVMIYLTIYPPSKALALT